MTYHHPCERLINNQVTPFMKNTALRNIVNLEMIAFGDSVIRSHDPPEIECHYEEKECYGNMVDLCSVELFPKYAYEFIACEEKRMNYSPDGILECATPAQVDGEIVIACAENEQGLLLHMKAGERTPENVSFPYIRINGNHVDLNQITFKKAVCDAYNGERPRACDE